MTTSKSLECVMLRASLLACILSGAIVNPGFSGNQAGDTTMVLNVFLCGDLMTGRGIDQALPHSVDPTLKERSVTDARRYVEIAERASGPMPETIGFEYIWGDALDELRRTAPDVRVVNLETAVTRGGSPWENKGVHYRMHPDNVGVLTAAGIDCAVLANNHVLDWGYDGLDETLATLDRVGVRAVGAGTDRAAAERLGVFPCGNGARVLVYGCGLLTSGIPPAWAAREGRAGVNLLPGLNDSAVDQIGESVARVRRRNDIVVVSIHWGGNWGYDISAGQIRFAHALVGCANELGNSGGGCKEGGDVTCRKDRRK